MQTEPPEFPYKRLATLYILALALVGGAVTVGYLMVSALQDRTRLDSAVVTAAAEQRVLAQRVAALAAIHSVEPSAHARAANRSEQLETLERFRASHVALGRANEALRNHPLSFDSRAAPLANLQSKASALEAAIARGSRDGAEAGVARADIDAACDDYLREMGHVVTLHQRESDAFAVQVGWMLKGVALGALLIVIIMAMFLHRPMIRRLRKSYAELRGAHHDLNEELARRLALEKERDTLQGLLPICSGCKKIRDSHGDWEVMESYIEERSEVRFSHGLCEDCIRRLYPTFADRILDRLASRTSSPGRQPSRHSHPSRPSHPSRHSHPAIDQSGTRDSMESIPS